MSLEMDNLVDRRRLNRRVRFWRITSFLAVAIALVAFVLAGSGGPMSGYGEPHIARVTISGLITGDTETLKLLKNVQESPKAQALLLSIESPGGTVSGSEELYESIRKLAAKKPVVAVVGNTAASGAYIAALGTDHIISRGGAIIGSIGVIAQIPNATKLLGNLGIEMETIRSSPLKASPSGVEPTPPEARRALEATVLDSFGWFRDLVKERRNLSSEEIARVADGRIFTGRQALPLKLIDEIGGEAEAIAWLQKEKKIDEKLPIRNWMRPETTSPLRFLQSNLLQSMSQIAKNLGLEDVSRLLARGDHLANDAALTGILALWQPGSGL